MVQVFDLVDQSPHCMNTYVVTIPFLEFIWFVICGWGQCVAFFSATFFSPPHNQVFFQLTLILILRTMLFLMQGLTLCLRKLTPPFVGAFDFGVRVPWASGQGSPEESFSLMGFVQKTLFFFGGESPKEKSLCCIKVFLWGARFEMSNMDGTLKVLNGLSWMGF